MPNEYEQVAFTANWSHVETPTGRLERESVVGVEPVGGYVTLYVKSWWRLRRVTHPRESCRFMRPVQSHPPNLFAAHSLSGLPRKDPSRF